MFEAIKIFIVRNHYTLINSFIRLVANTLYTDAPTQHVKKILLVRKGSIGDMVTVTPLIQSLLNHFPSATFDMLTQSFGKKNIGAEVILPPQWIHQFIEFDEQSYVELHRRIYKQNYDFVLELPQAQDTLYTQLRNVIYFRLCGINSGAGWEVSSTYFWRKIQLNHYSFINETERHYHNLSIYNLHLQPQTFSVSLQPIVNISTIQKPIITLAIGAAQARRKWPAQRYKQLASLLIDRGFYVCCIGDATDFDTVKEWEFPADSFTNFCSKLTVPESAYVIKQSQLFVGNDSGPMHLAYAVDTPSVLLFSARNYPNKWYPPKEKKCTVIADYMVTCAICVHQPCDNNTCMQSISVEMVWNAIEDYI